MGLQRKQKGIEGSHLQNHHKAQLSQMGVGATEDITAEVDKEGPSAVMLPSTGSFLSKHDSAMTLNQSSALCRIFRST